MNLNYSFFSSRWNNRRTNKFMNNWDRKSKRFQFKVPNIINIFQEYITNIRCCDISNCFHPNFCIHAVQIPTNSLDCQPLLISISGFIRRLKNAQSIKLLRVWMKTVRNVTTSIFCVLIYLGIHGPIVKMVQHGGRSKCATFY